MKVSSSNDFAGSRGERAAPEIPNQIRHRAVHFIAADVVIGFQRRG